MKLYITLASLVLVITGTSCSKTYDCTCMTRGTQSTYIQEISAQNGDDARDKCVDYQDETNRVSFPGVDCAID
jgi:hypothetical protein